MSLRANAILLSLGLAACGPVAIGAGIGELAGRGDTTTVVLLFVNGSDEAVRVLLEGIDGGGQPIPFPSGQVPPGGIVSLELPRAQALRVRAVQQGTDLATAPVTWDCRVEQPSSGTAVNLGLQAAVLSGLRASGSQSDAIALDRFTGEGSAATFTRIGGGPLATAPGRTAVHPGGGYLYTLRDGSAGAAELTAWRLDARNGELQSIAAEFGQAPDNPRTLDYSGAFADLDLFVEPLGRMLYVLQRQPAALHTVLSLLPILADGSLGAPDSAVRGLIGDIAARPDGRRLYLSEDTGDGSGYVLRDFAIDANGRIDFTAGQAALPCVNTQGGRFALHPTGRFLYLALRDPASQRVNLAAYSIGDNGGVLQVDRSCGGFATIDDLQVDPSGQTLHCSGTAIGGARRLLRHPLDPVTGALGPLSSQDLGQVSNLTTTDDPARAGTDPLRQIVYTAIGERLVPHQRQPDGSLQSVPGGASLPYGGPGSVQFVAGIRRGTVAVTPP